MGTYRLPLKRTNLYFDAHLINNFYTRWGFHEFIEKDSKLVPPSCL